MTWTEIKAKIDQMFVDEGFDPDTMQIEYIDFSYEPSELIVGNLDELIIE